MASTGTVSVAMPPQQQHHTVGAITESILESMASEKEITAAVEWETKPQQPNINASGSEGKEAVVERCRSIPVITISLIYFPVYPPNK